MISTTLPVSSVIINSDLTTFVADNFTLDRYLGDTLSLPYSFEEISIKPNELASQANVINSAVYKLYHNFAYLNAQTKLINNDFPANYKGFVAGGGFPEGYGWHGPTVNTGSAAVTGSPALSGCNDIAVVDDSTALDNFTIFVAQPKHLLMLNSDHDETTVVTTASTNAVSQATNINFGNIAKVEITSEHRLILLDDSLRTVTKFNVDNIITSNPGLSGVILVEEVIGGLSQNAYDRTRFLTPVDIAIGPDDKVYVLDTGNKNIKIYDMDLNWITTLYKPADFDKGNVVDIEVDSDGKIFMLYSNGFLITYDPDTFKTVDELTFEEPLESDESYVQLTFSRNNANILYALTNKSIFKKFKSKLSRSIGKFRLSVNNIEGETFSSIKLLDTIRTDYDYVYTYSQNTSVGGKIFEFDETVSYETVAYDSYKDNLYSYEAMRVRADEFVTGFVYNKMIKKLIYNHIHFRDNIHHTFIAAYDSTGAIQHTGYEGYGKSGVTLDGFVEDQDYYVANNEILTSDTVNRTISKLYDIQLDLKTILTERYTNTWPLTTQAVGLKNEENRVL